MWFSPFLLFMEIHNAREVLYKDFLKLKDCCFRSYGKSCSAGQYFPIVSKQVRIKYIDITGMSSKYN